MASQPILYCRNDFRSVNNVEVEPMSFDSIALGHTHTSQFPIFQLPSDLFPNVTRYLSAHDLGSLALVDQDCHVLAAVSQFKCIQLNLATTSRTSLLQAYDPCIRNHTSLIRSCVRKLKLVMYPDPKSSPNNRMPLVEFLAMLGDIIEEGLPNLHILDCDIPLALPPSFLRSIFKSPIKRLRLNGIMLIDDLQTPLLPGLSSMPLEALNLKVSWPGLHNHGHTFEFFNHLLRHAAPTLQRLEIQGRGANDHVLISGDMPQFPHLRTLVLNQLSVRYEEVVDLLLGPNSRIHTLALDSTTESAKQFLQHRGYMSSLNRFWWLNDPVTLDGAEQVVSFLSRNTHLEALHTQHPLPADFVNDTLLPLLTSQFHLLTSLKLVVTLPTVNDGFLEALGTLGGLQHLWLSAGSQHLSLNTWPIDIPSILKRLAPLQCLQTLAFTRETHITENLHPLAPTSGDYYSAKAFPIDAALSKYFTASELQAYEETDKEGLSYDEALLRQIRLRRSAWERWHIENMSKVAESIGMVFKKLDWCFVGQLAFSFSETGKGDESRVILESPCRSPCSEPVHRRMSFNGSQSTFY